ncbi:hypothetical protein HMPREF9243_1588 [Aerococcus sp. Group 1]|nr:hypothetical protein HMPREF9243_1588 [Aerococcus sp. Group 1]
MRLIHSASQGKASQAKSNKKVKRPEKKRSFPIRFFKTFPGV